MLATPTDRALQHRLLFRNLKPEVYQSAGGGGMPDMGGAGAPPGAGGAGGPTVEEVTYGFRFSMHSIFEAKPPGKANGLLD